ncbi:MAG: cache domain-containing protein [Deltaproteobacteria bacterium]|nr:cache domain-containing protein [Deltaproteobacteria bacterium]
MKLSKKLPLTTGACIFFGLSILVGLLAFLLEIDQKERLERVRQSLEGAAAEQLHAKIDVTYSMINAIHENGQGQPSPQLQQECLTLLKKTRFGPEKKSYFWVHTLDEKNLDKPKMLMHPTLPQLDGTDISDFIDKKRFKQISYRGIIHDNNAPEVAGIKETNLFVDMNRACAASSAGEGIVLYYWPDPSRRMDVGYSKMSAVKYFKPWGWVIGTGEYVDNIDAEVAKEQAIITQHFRAMIYTMLFSLLGLMAIAVGLNIYLVRRISIPLRDMAVYATKIEHGILTDRLPMGRTINCSQKNKCGKNDCPSFGRESVCWIESGSFAAVPVCPRAVEGHDCRTCSIYRDEVKDEIYEMASAFNSMVEALNRQAELTEQMAKGDLTQSVVARSPEDKLGQALQSMVQDLNKVLGRVNLVVDIVARGSREIASSTHSLSMGAAQQSAAVDEISISMKEIGKRTKLYAENSQQANRLATSTRSSAENGNIEVNQMVTAMNEMKEAGHQIVKIVRMIDDIAFQTNILAINAAIESARAGRHGRGFAVVAEEVRHLSNRSAQAAQEAAGLVSATIDKVETGAAMAGRTETILSEIVDSAIKVADLIGQIASAANEQSESANQIGLGLSQIGQVTSQNATTAQATAKAVDELSTQAGELSNLMCHFKLNPSLPR